MRFYLAEIPVLECPQIKPCKQSHYNEYRNADHEFREKFLPEYAGVAQILEPHPVSNEIDHHHDKADNNRNQHDDN